MNSAFRCAFCFSLGSSLTLLLPQPQACPRLSRSPETGAASELGSQASALPPDFSALLSPHEGTSAASPTLHQLCILDRVATLGVLGPEVVSGDGRTRGSPWAALSPTFGPNL